jgi:hypothetical protein
MKQGPYVKTYSSQRIKMKVTNLPPKEAVSVSVIPTHTEQFNSVLTRCFRLKETDYSLEEAVSIEGFVGYVHAVRDEYLMSTGPLSFDERGRPRPIVGVVFTNPKRKQRK